VFLVLVVFGVASAATWAAGIQLSKSTDELDRRLGIGDALGGGAKVNLQRPGRTFALLRRLECTGLAHPASGHAPLGAEEDATADVRTLWTAPLTEAAFDGGPPFAHSPVGPPGNQRFAGSRRVTVTEQFPSIVVRLKQSMSGRGELIGPCLSGIKVGGYITPQHRAVAAQVPDKCRRPEVVRAPGFQCQ